MGIDSLKSGIAEVVKEHPVASSIGAIGAASGVIVGATAIAGAIKRRKAKRHKSRNSRKRSNRAKRKYKYARTARKKKDRSHKRIRMTKNGQPYIILASGKAKFISKRSAHNSRKRKGGRY